MASKKHKTLLFMLIFLIFLGGLFPLVIISKNEMRSSDDYIVIALYQDFLEIEGISKYDARKRAEAYFKKNPGCCTTKVINKGVMGKILSSEAIEVDVYVEVNKGNGNIPYYRNFYKMNSEGKVIVSYRETILKEEMMKNNIK